MDLVQPYLIFLPPALARRALETLDQTDSPFADMSELVRVSLENLFALNGVKLKPAPGAASTELGNWTLNDLLKVPSGLDFETVNSQQLDERLFVLTNRLNPIPLMTRILLNMIAKDEAPDINQFVETAGKCARELGHRLRQDDEHVNRGALDKRSIGWPVGPEANKSLRRFTVSFLLSANHRGPTGPLVYLGLVGVVENRILPTALGVNLARAPSSLMGETEGGSCSAEQQSLLCQAIRGMPEEFAAVKHFAEAVRNANGHQPAVDRRLSLHHKNWSPNLVAAHRAAMVGRLRDLGLLEVTGRGTKAVMTITLEGDRFINDAQEA